MEVLTIDGVVEVPQVLPLIYTTKGNVPEASLTYAGDWKIGKDFIMFTQTWHDSTGELVKNNVHMYALQGIAESSAEQAKM
jgi:hypothetical protein